jgi:hypothetical protein
MIAPYIQEFVSNYLANIQKNLIRYPKAMPLGGNKLPFQGESLIFYDPLIDNDIFGQDKYFQCFL